ncbi:hypothetical protein TIFTF001_023739 [Ficus carica]|uniref:Uncharacterized protein n=1 Tax=Ficus carica TaxID=3494 RepID=A0AA88ANZ5_FICCA|nr:hypothetical protein TIFTF001_023739 [Ficus carica]
MVVSSKSSSNRGSLFRDSLLITARPEIGLGMEVGVSHGEDLSKCELIRGILSLWERERQGWVTGEFFRWDLALLVIGRGRGHERSCEVGGAGVPGVYFLVVQ